ncbi:2'-5' RNA ligase family protein [Streptomyces sp. NPDC049954]|uniref:2'-5' RNA ligase family protein n=1 Tax=Streptomyces sp. NPDC049954 TaxID=3155779 RepID=UPI003422253F
MRLFTALIPPAEALAELARALRPVRSLPGADRLRWTEGAGRHLTLAFHGEADPGALDPALRAAARAHGPLRLALHGGGHFGDSTLWTGLRGEVQALRELADAVPVAPAGPGRTDEEDEAGRGETGGRDGTGRGETCGPGGAARREHPYRPHLTLARGDRRTPLGPFARALDAFTGTPWTVRELSLVRSELPPGGLRGARPRYVTQATYPLTGGAPGDR